MTPQEFIASILSATEGAPAVMRLEIWPSGIGLAPPPEEIVVKVYPVDTQQSPPPTTYTLYSQVDGLRVRDSYNTTAKIAGVLALGASIEATATLYDALGYKWRQIASGPFAGKFAAQSLTATATVYLSASAPK